MKSDNVIVCFLDILGYQELVDTKRPEDVYSDFLDIITLKKGMEENYKKGSTISKNINIQILSDSILLTVDIDNIPDFYLNSENLLNFR